VEETEAGVHSQETGQRLPDKETHPATVSAGRADDLTPCSDKAPHMQREEYAGCGHCVHQEIEMSNEYVPPRIEITAPLNYNAPLPLPEKREQSQATLGTPITLPDGKTLTVPPIQNVTIETVKSARKLCQESTNLNLRHRWKFKCIEFECYYPASATSSGYPLGQHEVF
jgi:hypothetical protein